MVTFFLHLTHLQCYSLYFLGQCICTALHDGVFRVDNHRLAMAEELHLLAALDLETHEVFLVGNSKVGHHADGGLDDVLQPCHLAWPGDACLDDGKVVVGIDKPHAQRHAHLTVVAARRPADIIVGRKQLVEPFLHRRLAVGTSDANNRNIQLATMIGRQVLQCLQRRLHHKEVAKPPPILPPRGGVAIRMVHPPLGGQEGGFLHHKVPHSSSVQFLYILMSIVLLCPQGKEERLLWKTKASAVNQQPVDSCLCRSFSLCANHLRNLFNLIHFLQFVDAGSDATLSQPSPPHLWFYYQSKCPEIAAKYIPPPLPTDVSYHRHKSGSHAIHPS